MRCLVCLYVVFILLVLPINCLHAQNNCLQFDGINDYVALPSSLYTTHFGASGGQLTIEYWFKGSQLQSPVRFQDAGGWVVAGWMSPPQFIISTDGGTSGLTIGTDAAIEDGQWHHVACVWQRSTVGGFRVYLDGVLTASRDSGSSSLPAISSGLCLGALGGTSEFLAGSLDEVRIWNVARTQAQIRQWMHRELNGNENGLVACYRFDHGSGTTLDDLGLFGYDGALGNMAGNEWRTSSAMFGPRRALVLNGADDYLECTTTADSNLETFSAFTFEAWANLDNTGTNQKIFGKFRDWSPGNYYMLTVASGMLALEMNANGNAIGEYAGSVPSGQWTHLAITFAQGSPYSTILYYINGTLVHAIDDFANESVDVTSTWPFRIGCSPWDTNFALVDGQVDDVRVWNVARTATQIRGSMCADLDGDESGLVACYRFDNGSGTVLPDFSGSAYDCALVGMAGTEWAASAAYNIWLDTGSSNWATATNWSRGSVPGSSDHAAVYSYSGGTNAVLAGSPTVAGLVLGGASAMTLNSGFTVSGNLVLQSDLDLNGQAIALGTTGTLVEDGGSLYGTGGTISATRNLTAAISSYENVAGLGAELTAAVAMGNTTITRGHTAVSGEPDLQKSVHRYYDIDPTTNSGLNAGLRFNYNGARDLNGISEADLALYSWDGSYWNCDVANQTYNMTSDWVAQTGIDSFSKWTLGDEDDPTAIDLVSFTARGHVDSVQLEWETASEVDTAGFHVLRRPGSGGEFARVTEDLIPADGGPAWGAVYEFEDHSAKPGACYEYLLEDVTTGGLTDRHGPVSAWAGVTDIRVNGVDRTVTAASGERISVVVRAHQGPGISPPRELWVWCETPLGRFSCVGQARWVRGTRPYEGSPSGFAKGLRLLHRPLPAGSYVFCFAADAGRDGVPDADWLDRVVVEITPP